MITQQEIAGSLQQLGLQAGDHLLLHSSLSSLGQVRGGAAAVVDAFLDILGEDGTLMVPIFGALGIITEEVRRRPEAVQSHAPLCNVAAIGGQAEALCRDHWQAELAHGEDTPYTRLAAVGGYICLLGVDQDRNTTLHTAEELLRLPYLKTTPPQTFRTPEGEMTKSWPFFPGPHRDFIGIDRELRESGKMTMGTIGHAVVRLIRSQDLLDIAMETARLDPAAFLCDNPHCEDCVGQRAALRRARLKQEPFTLAASTTLAGRYLPEIVETCRAAGIDYVEVDGLHGTPACAMPPERLADFTRDLREQGLNVTAWRLHGIGKATLPLIRAAGKAAVPRVILPLTALASNHLQAANRSEVVLSFTTQGYDAETFSGQLPSLVEQGHALRVTFNPVHFASLGEKPFLKSFKAKLRRYIDQLDIADATRDGTPQPLAQGHAEIKELISILRCASFSGAFTLTKDNVGTLGQTAQAFMDLLDKM